MPAFPAITHVAVTVTDLDRSTRWYTSLFGSEPVLDEDETTGGFHHTVFALDGGQLFGLHTHPGDGTGGPADEQRTGLGPRLVRLRRPRRAGGLDPAARRAGCRPRRDLRRPLRVRGVVPRPGQHRPGVLRPTGGLSPAGSTWPPATRGASGSSDLGGAVTRGPGSPRRRTGCPRRARDGQQRGHRGHLLDLLLEEPQHELLAEVVALVAGGADRRLDLSVTVCSWARASSRSAPRREVVAHLVDARDARPAGRGRACTARSSSRGCAPRRLPVEVRGQLGQVVRVKYTAMATYCWAAVNSLRICSRSMRLELRLVRHGVKVTGPTHG